MLRKYIQEKKEKWDDYLDTCTFAYNTSRHESTKFTTFEIMFGRKAILPLYLDAGVHQGPCNEMKLPYVLKKLKFSRKSHSTKLYWRKCRKTLFLLRRNRRSSMIRNTVRLSFTVQVHMS